MIFIHMREGLQELQDGPSSPSTPSIMLSMGGGFRGQGRKISWSKIITVATSAHDSSSMLSTMLKYGGGCATLHYEHREGQ